MRWILLIGLLAACASTGNESDNAGAKDAPGEAADAAERPAPGTGVLPRGSLLRTSREAEFMAMVDDLAGADIVYVGESHTSKAHHAVQLLVIDYLYSRGRLHAVGMEMFQRKFQPVLDEYTEGRISEAEMLRRTEWKKRWGYDVALYRPILSFCRQHRLPIVALNVETEIRKAARKVGIKGLPQVMRRTLPPLDDTDVEHRAYLDKIYRQHLPPGTKLDPAKFEAFYRGMLLWDDTMADTVVRWFQTAPETAQIVVLAGTGHIANRYGIPNRVHRRNGKDHATVICMQKQTDGDNGSALHARRYADFVWITE